MARNIVQGGLNLPLVNVGMVVTVPATNTTTVVPKSGTACLAGRIPGVAEGDVDTDTSITTLNTNCIAELAVQGVNNSGVSGADANSAVAVGDLIYMGADGVLSKRTTGTPFGTAFGSSLSSGGADTRTGTVVSAGATTTIRVWVGKIN